MNEKERILKQLEAAQKYGGYTLNLTLPAAMAFLKAAGKHDFFIDEFTGEKKALYIRLYNQEGYFFDNHLWGFYSDKQIAKIFYNIIMEIKA